jgi:hypothetical protein
MADVPDSAVAKGLLTLLQETFEGPSGPSTYYIDNDPASGFLAALDRVTAEEASLSPWPDAPSIAGHAYHAAFHLEMSAAWMRGDRADRDWAKSWAIREVGRTEWERVRGELKARYAELVETIREKPAARAESLATSIGAIAHAAYHLGAIRQRVAALTAARNKDKALNAARNEKEAAATA